MQFLKSITNSYFTGMFSVALLALVISSSINIFFEYREFLSEVEQIRTVYIDRQKEMIKDEVDKAVEYIIYMKSQAERRLKENIKERTNEAVAIAQNLYNENLNRKSRSEIEKIIRDALRPVRFNNGRGYYFATDLTGIEQLFADRPELEGKNLLGMEDTQGKFVIQDMIKIAKTQKEGFYRYQWTKPNLAGKDFPKIAYIKLFEPLNWFFGTGEYLDDVEADLKNEALERIAKIRFGDNGYIFILSFDGVTLMNDTQRHLIGQNNWDMTDPNGVKVIQEGRKTVENPDGGFIHYVWNKPSESKPSPKISFTKGIHEWEWMVGAGVYIDEIEKKISAKRDHLFDAMKREVIRILLIFVSLFGFIFPVARIVSNRLHKNMKTFSDFFSEAATKSIKINPDNIDILEFKGLVNSANHMVEEREHSIELLRQSEDRYKKAQRMGKVGNWEYDIESDIFWGSDESKRIYGYDVTSDHFTTDEVEKCILERERVHQALTDLIKKDKPYNLEFEIRPISGPEYRIIKSIAEIVRDDYGKPVKVVGVIQDITEQKMAEEQILQSQEQLNEKNQFLSAILQHTNIMTVLLDSNLDFIWVNQAYADSCKHPPSLFPGKNLFDLYPHKENQTIFENVARTGEAYFVTAKPFEFPDQPERGVTYWDWSLIPTKNDAGQVTGLVFTLVDVTERIKAQIGLKESEQKYRTIFENAPLGIFRSTPEGRFIEVNNTLAEMLGYKSSDEVLESIYSIAEQVYIRSEKRTAIVDEQLNTNGMTHHLNHYRRRDGSEFIANIYLKTVRDENGTPLYLEGIVEDITKKLESEKMVYEAKERFEKIFNSQLDAIFILNAEKSVRIVESNSAVSQLFGYNKDEICGQTIDILHADKNHLSEFQNTLFPAIKKNGYLTNFEFSMKRKNGEVFPTEHTVLELKDEQGKRTGWVSIVRDLTERKKIEKHLRQAQKMESIGNLAGGIAHDFNNILYPIIGMSELLLEDLPQGSLEYENVEEIFKAAERGGELVKQILAFSRQSEDKIIPVRIQHILKEVLKLSRASIPIDIEIKQHIQNDCGFVLADATKIHQIAMNLMTNAYHAVETAGGQIDVHLNEIELSEGDVADDFILKKGKYVRLTVSDTGCGIPSEIRDKIFEPYFTTKEQGKGTGLGLAVVYGIVKEHGGEIKVYSEQGKGSTFSVYLPLMTKTNETLVIKKPDEAQVGTARILLVDDEASILRMLTQILERLGYMITARNSSIEALEAFRSNSDKFDIVITDMTMPKMTGEQLANELIKIKPDISIILCTGFSERIDKEKAEALGIKGFLLKPIIKSELSQMVRRILDAIK